METFFSTVAQISFTIVGLFYVAITLDSATRDYWFGQYPHSRYAYINFLVMLMPGFLSLGGLVIVGNEKIMPSWPFAGIFLCLVYGSFYFGLRKLRKDPNFAQIVEIERELNIANTVFWDTVFLLALSIFGFSSSYVNNTSTLGQQEFGLKVLISFSIIGSTLSIIIFTRAFAEINRNSSIKSIVVAHTEIEKPSNKVYGDKAKNSGIIAILALITALIAFLAGWFLNKTNN
jgi:hypothetical protein